MECLFPIEGFRQPDGTVRLVGPRSDYAVQRCGHLIIPCGRCRGCRVERSRQWAVRMMHEAQMHTEASFITLTYDSAHLPTDNSLDVRHVQLFYKRLRKRLGKRISYFTCGEYGERFGRPHYHAALFGENFKRDREDLPTTRKGFTQWTSPTLTDAWAKGRVAVMELTFDSAQYVASYITAKITGEAAEQHYHGRKPEFATMSKNPAIGKRWFEEFKLDVYPRDEVVIRGVRGKPPKYYDQLLEKEDPKQIKTIKARRREKSASRNADQTHDRRETRALVAEIRARAFAREVDFE